MWLETSLSREQTGRRRDQTTTFVQPLSPGQFSLDTHWNGWPLQMIKLIFNVGTPTMTYIKPFNSKTADEASLQLVTAAVFIWRLTMSIRRSFPLDVEDFCSYLIKNTVSSHVLKNRNSERGGDGRLSQFQNVLTFYDSQSLRHHRRPLQCLWFWMRLAQWKKADKKRKNFPKALWNIKRHTSLWWAPAPTSFLLQPYSSKKDRTNMRRKFTNNQGKPRQVDQIQRLKLLRDKNIHTTLAKRPHNRSKGSFGKCTAQQ